MTLRRVAAMPLDPFSNQASAIPCAPEAFYLGPNSSELIRGWWFAADLSSQEKEKKGISVKKFPGIK